jgi:hypothetical protein
MSSRRWVGAVALSAALTAGAYGCNSARMVQWNGTTGVVAIPHNDNAWPDKNREHAEALMKEKCPHGYAILDEHEVIVGGEVEHSVTRVGYMRVRETTYHPEQEWQIVFQSADAPRLVPPPPAISTRTVVPAAPPPAAASSVVTPPTPAGLPPAPIPVEQ